MYTFRLQAVLDHRQFVEDNLKKELAEIRQQAMAAEKTLEQMENKEQFTAEALRNEQVSGLASDHVTAYHSYLRRLSDRIVAQKTLIVTIENRISRKQDEVLEAMKKRQILEKLKDQGLDRYNQTLVRKETNFIDEIAVNQYARKALNRHGKND
ncbi:flagellar export protein FliJ [Desulfosarcina ovata]|uniref:Flagellar FliJ protein n=1 Tax=Desulfosarcina ovata subsp. ovata TaxID=2752305 RepID=A0A5K8A704_9BACT|nr:flagellar export protein FliJ [Desulfosarcina ovata]BBO88297.1 hypothetical protein DSCOOX_14770 [Desulfosarcina ovata subsp. ovata]